MTHWVVRLQLLLISLTSHIGLGIMPPMDNLLNVPLVGGSAEGDIAGQESVTCSQQGGMNSCQEQGVCIGDALPPVPMKLAERIWHWEFVEMGELLPETWNLKPGEEASQQLLLARKKKPVTDLKTWVQCFAIYAGIISMKHPEVISDMMAYMVMIVKAAEEYAGLAWVRYDEAFRSQAAAKKEVKWSQVNPSLFAQCFTGRAQGMSHCELCLSSLHTSADCGLRKEPGDDTTARLQSVEASLRAISKDLLGPRKAMEFQEKPGTVSGMERGEMHSFSMQVQACLFPVLGNSPNGEVPSARGNTPDKSQEALTRLRD